MHVRYVSKQSPAVGWGSKVKDLLRKRRPNRPLREFRPMSCSILFSNHSQTWISLDLRPQTPQPMSTLPLTLRPCPYTHPNHP